MSGASGMLSHVGLAQELGDLEEQMEAMAKPRSRAGHTSGQVWSLGYLVLVLYPPHPRAFQKGQDK